MGMGTELNRQPAVARTILESTLKCSYLILFRSSNRLCPQPVRSPDGVCASVSSQEAQNLLVDSEGDSGRGHNPHRVGPAPAEKPGETFRPPRRDGTREAAFEIIPSNVFRVPLLDASLDELR